MCSIRAIRDILVADCSVLGVNTMRRFAYHPPIAVSPFLLALSISNFEQTLWRCGQLRRYVRKGSLGPRVHQDCNAMGDAAKISPCIPLTYTHNAIVSLLIIHIIPSRQIYVAIDHTLFIPSVSCLTAWRYLWNSMPAADNVSHTEYLQDDGCRCFSHLYISRDRIQVTRVFRYCGERQGQPVQNESSILVQEIDFE